MAMFGAGPAKHGALLATHLAARGNRGELAMFDWEGSEAIAYMIDGFGLAQEAGLGDPFEFSDRKRGEAEQHGDWTGTALELWVCLFMEHRRDRIQGQGMIGVRALPARLPMLDELCAALAAAVRADR
jgi:hypothetical protein